MYRSLPLRYRATDHASRVARIVIAMRDNPVFADVDGYTPYKARPACNVVTMPDGTTFPAGAKFVEA